MSNTPTLPERRELDEVLALVVDEARAYLATLDERPVRSPRAAAAARAFRRTLPEHGSGAAAALRELVERGRDAALASSGPRCFHLVIGGNTPAGLGADWLTSVLDPCAYAWMIAPLAVELELVALQWLRELLDLPDLRGGILTSGATMANFVGLCAARQWWGERQGIDVSLHGVAGLAPMPVFTSGYVHSSAVKVLGMLGVGRAQVRRLTKDAVGRLDLGALERELAALGGRPSVVIANAGEVNAGDFDPIADMARLARTHGAWLHVDGAFGLFARVSPRSAALAAGAELADSVTVDGHKWLNVPYDCGFSLVRDPELLARAFVYDAAYLPKPDDEFPVLGSLGPESSRRARSLAVWATLRAYGRSGVRAWVERHLELSQQLARAIDAADDLERLAEVRLCIVCFRFAPAWFPSERLDELNAALGAALLEDGRVYVGTTRLAGRTALRPALVNWRTRAADVDFFVAVVREVGSAVAKRLVKPGARAPS
jgi:glutamate/tyrosine decarboxylase-like PLP-dependent enzyme